MKKHNFNAGPSVIPQEVLEEASKDIIDFKRSGLSICELSHRSNEFTNILCSAEKNLRCTLNIPEEYSVLFMAGGATGQFSAIPLNLATKDDNVLYIVGGSWSKLASKEASKYCNVSEVEINYHNQLGSDLDSYINRITDTIINDKSKYVYLCTNETINGTFIDPTDKILEKNKECIVIADMSSEILTRKLNVNSYGLIFAGAQKNVGIPGVTIVIIRNNLLGTPSSLCPTILDYTIASQNKSLYNTPSTLSIYICDLMLKWSVEKGGIEYLEDKVKKRSQIIYGTLEMFPSVYCVPVKKDYRSLTNVVFKLVENSKEKDFLQNAEKLGIVGISGHRSVGGFRVSLYNAISDDSVDCLEKYLHFFANAL